MCMEDIILGREKHSATKTVAVPGIGTVPLVGDNERRTGLTFIILSGTATITPTTSGQVATDGFLIGTTQYRHDFDVEQYGDMVKFGWTAVGTGGACSVFVIETFLERMK